jgi:hypothetical protein
LEKSSATFVIFNKITKVNHHTIAQSGHPVFKTVRSPVGTKLLFRGNFRFDFVKKTSGHLFHSKTHLAMQQGCSVDVCKAVPIFPPGEIGTNDLMFLSRM